MTASSPISADRLGWVGVGNIGMPMLRRLLDAGHRATVCDRRTEAFDALDSSRSEAVHRAATPAELAERSDVVFLSLPDADALRAVVTGPAGLTTAPFAHERRRVIVNTCTSGASVSAELAEKVVDADMGWVDCPVSGGPRAAEVGMLSVMVSGGEADIDRLRPLLKCLGPAITDAGRHAGAAQTLKLVNNAIIVTSYIGTLEAFVFGAKAGLSPQTMLDAINAGTLAPNGTTRIWLPEYILKGRPFGAALHLLTKDVGLMLSESALLGVPAELGEAAMRVARMAREAGLSDDADLMDLVHAIERVADYTLPVSP